MNNNDSLSRRIADQSIKQSTNLFPLLTCYKSPEFSLITNVASSLCQPEAECKRIVIAGEEYRVTAISPAYNLLLSVRQRRLRYLGHLLRLPHDSVVRRTLVAMAGGGNRYPEGSLFMECQGSELKDLETLAVNRTAWRSKVTTLVV